MLDYRNLEKGDVLYFRKSKDRIPVIRIRLTTGTVVRVNKKTVTMNLVEDIDLRTDKLDIEKGYVKGFNKYEDLYRISKTEFNKIDGLQKLILKFRIHFQKYKNVPYAKMRRIIDIMEEE